MTPEPTPARPVPVGEALGVPFDPCWPENAAEALATEAQPSDGAGVPVGEVERLRQALEDVVNPLQYLQRMAEAEGSRLGGMAYSIANDISTVQSIAKDALAATPKAPTSTVGEVPADCSCEVAFGQNEGCPVHGTGTAWRAANPQADMRARPHGQFATPPAPNDDLRAAELRGEQRAIARVVNAARAIGFQAGVGGRETAGAIVSYLATSPDEIAPFVAGELTPLDFAGDWMRGGCLTWHAANGKVVSPEDAAALAERKDQAGGGEKSHG